MRNFIVLFFLIVFSSACATSINYKAIGVFPSTGEEIDFDVNHPLMFGATELTGHSSSGALCKAWVHINGIHAQYDMVMTCNDGRTIAMEWFTEDSWAVGKAVGMDQNGETLIIVSGGNPNTLKQRVFMWAAKAGVDIPTAGAGSVKNKGGHGFGTGFFVSTNGILVTSAHVVEGADVIALYDSKAGKAIEARVLSIDSSNDVAVLKADIKSKPIPLAAKFNQVRGEEVLTLGYPSPSVQGAEQKATFGRINATTGVQDDIRFTQVDLPIQPGNSGGPLMNTRGEVTGIITATIRESSGVSMQNVNYALKIDYLYPLLAQAAPEVRPAAGASRTMPQLVESYEDSVMLLVVGY